MPLDLILIVGVVLVVALLTVFIEIISSREPKKRRPKRPIAEDCIMKRIGKFFRKSLLSFGFILPANARTRRDTVNELKVKKNAQERIEKKLEN